MKRIPFTYTFVSYKPELHRPLSVAEMTRRAERLGAMADVFGCIAMFFLAILWAIVAMV